MNDRPSWRRMFDAWNDQVGTRLEHVVRTDAFADQAAWFAEVNRRRTEMGRWFSRRFLHFWNLPSASDVAALKRQIESLDRQVHRVNRTLQEVRDAGELKRHA
jgi:hypothetical protein